MSGAPRIRSSNITDKRVILPNKIKNTEPVRKVDETAAMVELRFTEEADDGEENEKKEKKRKKKNKMAPTNPALKFSPPTLMSFSRVFRGRKEELMGLSLNVSCSSNYTSDTLRGRSASTEGVRFVKKDGRRRQQSLPRPDGIDVRSPEISQGKIRCPWITTNSDSGYVAFHDEEWGVPVHDDRKLFELLVLSGALAELTWPAILNKRREFREVFLDFDPKEVSKLNEEVVFTSSLLSEPKLRAIIGNSRQILKIVDEFGSFDRYCWSFVKNSKPIVGKFRYSRQVPVKTSKAEVISKDLMRRGFRCVGPTITYSFMQVAGITNDHLTCCYRFEQCCSIASNHHNKEKNSQNPSNNIISPVLDLAMDFQDLNLL